MATVSIVESPDKYMPIYNDIVYTVSSPESGNCNFRFICDVYAQNGTVSPVFITRLKQFPVSPNGYATFKINRVLEDFMVNELAPKMWDFNPSAINNNILNYQVKFGVEYDTSTNCDAGTTIFPNLTTATTAYAINAALQYKEWPNWDASDFLLANSTATLGAGRFLTNAPQDFLITQDAELVFQVLTEIDPKYLYIETFDETGSFNNWILGNWIGTVNSTGKTLQLIPAGPVNLNSFNGSGGIVAGGPLPIITSRILSYRLTLLNSSFLPISEAFSITLDRRPTKNTPYRLWWLNRLGGFDSYTFTLNNKRTVSSTRNAYTKLLGNPGTATYAYNPTFGPRGRTVLSVDAQETQTFQSNWLTEEEALWMEELFTSPEVYISELTPTICFTDTFAIASPAGDLRLYLDEKPTYDVGDYIIVDKNDKTLNSQYDGIYAITAVNKTSIPYYIEYTPPSIGTSGGGESGTIYTFRYASSLDPVVITSASYEQKTKNDLKNINYSIEITKAYNKTLQRG